VESDDSGLILGTTETQNNKRNTPGGNNSCPPGTSSAPVVQGKLIFEFVTYTVSVQALLEFNAGSCQLTAQRAN